MPTMPTLTTTSTKGKMNPYLLLSDQCHLSFLYKIDIDIVVYIDIVIDIGIDIDIDIVIDIDIDIDIETEDDIIILGDI